VHPEPKSRILCATNVWFCCLAYASLKDLIYFHYHKDIWMGVANAKHSLENNSISNKFSQYNMKYHTKITFSQVSFLILTVTWKMIELFNSLQAQNRMSKESSLLEYDAMLLSKWFPPFWGNLLQFLWWRNGTHRKTLFHCHLVYDGSHVDWTRIKLEFLMWDAGEWIPQSLNGL